jgi:hypothetical protein
MFSCCACHTEGAFAFLSCSYAMSVVGKSMVASWSVWFNTITRFNLLGGHRSKLQIFRNAKFYLCFLLLDYHVTSRLPSTAQH